MAIRICGECGRPPREDDPMVVLQEHAEGGPTRTFHACAECAAAARGEPPFEPARHPPGRDYPFAVCGVCRHAVRDGDHPKPMRLHAEDVAGTGLAPGCYGSCADCRDHFKPKIFARLAADPPPHMPRVPMEQLGDEWLL